ncbi:hypothetical protein O6H91_02G000200 [Diphasiastrum complanatum]|uniref:Uncharacterized protein n=1 Tax=Diphasiastrum complanatum TaxID=34168 RepID=A0ACC2ECJ3_DIPCM|nr:hypothetical protein O6H91_02G000200 [Diphasiastrum complanatum]
MLLGENMQSCNGLRWSLWTTGSNHKCRSIAGSLLCIFLTNLIFPLEAAYAPLEAKSKNAYATMLYMGTPHDYEFYVAARVMMQSLAHLKVDADLVVIVSKDVPQRWIDTLTGERVRVVSVDNIENPYRNQANFDMRFMFTLNKIYAWSLVDYDRVVMLDADNLFLQKTDELFQCGQFCAAFINPCIFHTGLFVLEPSNETFNDLLHEIEVGRQNPDGADQGFLMAYFEDLLERPLFIPPVNGSKLTGFYRLPLGYQMDASYFYLRLRWNVPCGPNSVITFPSLPNLKPWYWWSWPILPLGLAWHEQRRTTIGYGTQIPVLALEALFYLITMIIAMLVRRRFPPSERLLLLKSCLGRGPCSEKVSFLYLLSMKTMPVLALAGSFLFPFLLVPTTVHPLMGWSIFLLGSLSLLATAINVFQLPALAGMTPWLVICGALVAMGSPIYSNGITRVVSVAVYAFLTAPFLWWALTEVTRSMEVVTYREPLMAWTNGRQEPQSEVMKLC